MIPRFLLFLPALLLSTCVSFAEVERDYGDVSAILKSLAVNRSLLAEYELEYTRLKQEHAASPSYLLEKKLTDAEYKVKALSEESRNLETALSKEEMANEFIKDLLLKTSITQYKKFALKNSEPPLAPKPLQTVKPAVIHYPPMPPRKTAAPPAPTPASPTAAPKLPTETPAQMHERALRYVAEQNLEKAGKLYEEIVLANPDDDQAYIIMGHTYLLRGQFEKAEQSFQNAVHIDPENINEIVPFYQNIVVQNPSDDKALANLGFALLIVGDLINAYETFKTALEINPDNAAAHEGIDTLQRLENKTQ